MAPFTNNPACDCFRITHSIPIELVDPVRRCGECPCARIVGLSYIGNYFVIDPDRAMMVGFI